MQVPIDRARDDFVCKQSGTPEELAAEVYAALAGDLPAKGIIPWGPFDSMVRGQAAPDDLDLEWMSDFVRAARRVRKFPPTADAAPKKLLRHLHSLSNDRIANAAALLFGKDPQRSLGSSEIKCAHFRGTKQVEPIPSYQIYRDAAFGLIDQAVDLVVADDRCQACAVSRASRSVRRA